MKWNEAELVWEILIFVQSRLFIYLFIYLFEILKKI